MPLKKKSHWQLEYKNKYVIVQSMYRQAHNLIVQIQKGLQSNAMNGINYATLEDGTDRLC